MSGSQKLIADYLDRILNTTEHHPQLIQESTLGADEGLDQAAAALQSLRQDPERPIEESHLSRLEAIILPLYRPVFNIVQDTYSDPGPPWNSLADGDTRKRIETAIKAVGRVELTGCPGRKYGGTAFVVGEKLLMTNRHVAELFANGVGDKSKDLTFIPGRKAALDFKQEVVPGVSVPLAVIRVVLVHPYWDAAILEVDGLTASQPQLFLDSTEPEHLDGTDVAVIGYPALDPSANVGVQIKVFGGRFDKKRLQPGKTMGYRSFDSYGRQVLAISHDCSTLGGNSGSVVLNLATGNVLGLHFGGEYLKANYAVPAWQLSLDPHVTGAGVRRAAATSGNQQTPPWVSAWDNLTQTAGARSAAIESPAAPEGWIERISAPELVRSLLADRDTAMASLTGTLGTAGARDLAGILDAPQVKTDRARPEIVWVHGPMGAHLAGPDLLRERRWLDGATLAGGTLAASLALGPDGGPELETDGPIRTLYMDAHLTWRRAGFVVHDFVYDWRRSLIPAADCLHDFLQLRLRRAPGSRFALVAHSSGGLVCAVYANRHPEWSDLVQRAIFLGVPLGGTFTPAAAITGQLALFGKLSLVSHLNDIEALRRMAATFPGWVDALPNPHLFPGTEPLYTINSWPDEIAPGQRWLDQSRFLKPTILRSPLLDRVTVLASADYPTVASAVVQEDGIACGPADAPGDGATPFRSAALDGLPAFRVSSDHWSMTRDRGALQAVTDLLTSGTCSLERIPAEDFRPLSAPDHAISLREGAARAMLERFQKGQVRRADLEWLLSSAFDNLPD